MLAPSKILVLVVLVLLVVAGGVFLPGGRVAGQSTNGSSSGCDNQCRMRKYQYICQNGNCWEYEFDNCLPCAPGLNVECVDSETVFNPNCQNPYPFNVYIGVTFYNSCSNKCECDSLFSVQGDNDVFGKTGGSTVIYKKCQ
jgi:hypothetical protein